MNRLIEAMNFESDAKNWKYPFPKMCKNYGKDFIDFIKVLWEANDGVQTEEEFCEMNDVPKSYFDKHLKK